MGEGMGPPQTGRESSARRTPMVCRAESLLLGCWGSQGCWPSSPRGKGS